MLRSLGDAVPGGGGAGSDLFVSAGAPQGLLSLCTGETSFSMVSPFVGVVRGVGRAFLASILASSLWFVPSPNLNSVSTALSKLPFKPFSTCAFFFSFKNPISFKYWIFLSKASSLLSATAAPKNFECFLFSRRGGLGSPYALYPGLVGGLNVPCLGTVEDADRRLGKKNLLFGLGGSAGGSPPELVLPVCCREPGLVALELCDPPWYVLCSYFWRMNRSIAPSTSSMSTGMAGCTPLGLYNLLFAVLPTLFILSTCSLDQLSILKLLTFEICVPNLRCKAAHRIHKKIPRLQLAHPVIVAHRSALVKHNITCHDI